ncbi:hypothetical protein B1987_09350 [Mycobacterium kansasii]|nr:hypothetical protein B1987_09350 [Mycobacterium kansasii]
MVVATLAAGRPVSRSVQRNGVDVTGITFSRAATRPRGCYGVAAAVVKFWHGREELLYNKIRVTGGRVKRPQP